MLCSASVGVLDRCLDIRPFLPVERVRYFARHAEAEIGVCGRVGSHRYTITARRLTHTTVDYQFMTTIMCNLVNLEKRKMGGKTCSKYMTELFLPRVDIIHIEGDKYHVMFVRHNRGQAMSEVPRHRVKTDPESNLHWIIRVSFSGR